MTYLHVTVNAIALTGGRYNLNVQVQKACHDRHA